MLESIEEEKVYNEVIQGIGYDILKGLFDPLEIRHARETILYLISKQGSKATHFQVCLSSLITIKPWSCNWILEMIFTNHF